MDVLVSVSRFFKFIIDSVRIFRPPTLYGVPRDETLRMGHTKTCSELKSIFAALIKQSKTLEPSSEPDIPHNLLIPEGYMEANAFLENHESNNAVTTTTADTSLIPATQLIMDASGDGPDLKNSVSHPPEDDLILMPKLRTPTEVHEPIEQVTQYVGEISIDAETSIKVAETLLTSRQETKPVIDLLHDSMVTMEAKKEPDTVSNSCELKKTKLKIRVKKPASSSRVEDTHKSSVQAQDLGNTIILNTQDGHNNDADHGVKSSSVSIDAPHRNLAETGNHNFEDVNSCQDVGSRVTASIGSAKPTVEEELVKELQCTADSSKVSLPLPPDDLLPAATMTVGEVPQASDVKGGSGPTDLHVHGKEKEKKKKEKEKKRKKNGHDDDPERRELKRQKKEKKEKKRKEKELAKLLTDKPKAEPSIEMPGDEKTVAGVIESGGKEYKPETRQDVVGEGTASSAKESDKMNDSGSNVASVEPISGEANVAVNRTDCSVNPTKPSGSSNKIKIRLKNRTLGKS